MVKYLTMIILLLACTSGFADDLEDHYLPTDPLKGTTHFTTKGCDKCHAIESRGGSFGPDLARSDLNGSLLDIASLMWNHSPQMSSMMSDLRVAPPEFTGDELAELAAYIFYIDYFDKLGDMAEGRRVFSAKGCANCHRVAGSGTRIGPNLSSLKKYASPIFLAQEMWNHGPQIKARMAELGVAWPEFDGAEISNLMAFLRDASPDTTSERIFMRPGNPRTGKELFRAKKCITCHEVLGEGREVGPDLTQSTFHNSVTSVAAMMWNHGPAIWERMEEMALSSPTFSGNELADLIAFLYFLRFFEEPANAQKGEMLFIQKGCQSCHHFGGQAVEGSVSLSTENPTSMPIELAAAMWNHSGEMSARMTRKKLRWPRLESGEMNDLLAYVLSRSR
jgi:cytochrome c2